MHDDADRTDTIVPPNDEGVSPSFFAEVRKRAPAANAEQPRTTPSRPRTGDLLRRLEDLKKA